jgi:hypothetical protein
LIGVPDCPNTIEEWACLQSRQSKRWHFHESSRIVLQQFFYFSFLCQWILGTASTQAGTSCQPLNCLWRAEDWRLVHRWYVVIKQTADCFWKVNY